MVLLPPNTLASRRRTRAIQKRLISTWQDADRCSRASRNSLNCSRNRAGRGCERTARSAEHTCVNKQSERLQSPTDLEYSSATGRMSCGTSLQRLNRQVTRNDKQTGQRLELVGSLQFERLNGADNKSVPKTNQNDNAHRSQAA